MKRLFVLFLTATFSLTLLSPFVKADTTPRVSTEAEITSNPVGHTYEDTDLISIWRVTRQGSIYSPVSVTSKVTIIRQENPHAYYVTKRELMSQTFKSYFDIYPSAQFGPRELNIRGQIQHLPKSGSYIIGAPYTAQGILSDDPISFDRNGYGASYGKTGFFAGSGAIQFDNTGQVDFNW
ncbi:hypothetical protein [Paenibacillus sp. 481]|uniref:hypothetical protein n=1 Tax=Paenibacillus sp. 481 TaxID=2835869 RepID=UPI001E5F9D90|nr:hypothetical protein [Paenibacillus sp. 481]UHA75613.1 hypothetical protein KIK04_11830 [Paenibacillus sp. 481]